MSILCRRCWSHVAVLWRAERHGHELVEESLRPDRLPEDQSIWWVKNFTTCTNAICIRCETYWLVFVVVDRILDYLVIRMTRLFSLRVCVTLQMAAWSSATEKAGSVWTAVQYRRHCGVATALDIICAMPVVFIIRWTAWTDRW